MKNILWLILVLLIFACNSERIEDSPEEEPVNEFKLLKITQAFEDGDVSVSELLYENELLSQVKEINENSVFYTNLNYDDSDRLISATSTYNNEIKYSYSNDLITKKEFIDKDDADQSFTIVYEYNSNKRVKKSIQTRIGLELVKDYTYDSSNNVISFVSSLNPGTELKTTYDNKNNPLNLIYTAEIQAIEFIGGNNEIETYQSENMTYEYNDKGYPTKQTVFVVGKLESTITYEYSN